MAKKRVTIYVDEDEWLGVKKNAWMNYLSAGEYLMELYRAIIKKGRPVEKIDNIKPAQPEKSDSHKPEGKSEKSDVIKTARKKVEDMLHPDRSWDDSAPNPKVFKK